MASTIENNPRIDIELSLTPSIHAFSQPEPPKLTLKLTSKASTPITLFTWNTPLALPNALTSKGITITDTDTGSPVETPSVQVQRAPLKRTKEHSDEKYFVSIPSNSTIELSTGLGRAGGGVKPQPKSIVEQGWEVDDEGNQRKIRRSRFATGVDGLEPGKTYRIGLNEEALKKVWWAPVDREEVLVDGEREGSYVQDYEWKKTPLDWKVTEATLTVED